MLDLGFVARRRAAVVTASLLLLSVVSAVGATSASAATATLTVDFVLQGGGEPASTVAQIDLTEQSGTDSSVTCTSDCTFDVTTPPDVVTASITINDPTYVFVGWSGAPCSSGTTTDASCDVDVAGATTIHATVKARVLAPLDVTRKVDGAASTAGGSVDIYQGTTDGWYVSETCGSTCSGLSVQAGTEVQLLATPSEGYALSSWSGVTCAEGPSTASCTFTPVSAAAVHVVADFSLVPTTATIAVARKLGAGLTTTAGTVVGTPALAPPFTCGTTCSRTVGIGEVVTLVATPAVHFLFTGWSGVLCDEGTDSATCTTTVDADVTATATFAAGFTVSVARAGTAAADGTVTLDHGSSSDACPSTCSITVPSGTLVDLSANASLPTTRFDGFSAPCTGTTTSCSFVVSSDVSITATFTTVPLRTVTVDRGGAAATAGSVTIESPNDFTTCSTYPCTLSVPDGSTVTITTSATRAGYLGSWTNCDAAHHGTPQGAMCSVTPTSDVALTATFLPSRAGTLTVSTVAATGGPVLPGGAGVVTSYSSSQTDPISCPGDCTSTVRLNTGMTLRAKHVVGWTVSWTGCLPVEGGTGCQLYAGAASAVTATYTNVGTWTVTVTYPGAPTGTTVYHYGANDSDQCSGTPCTFDVTKGEAVDVTAQTQSASGLGVALASTPAALCPASSGAVTTYRYCYFTPTSAATISVTFPSLPAKVTLTVPYVRTGASPADEAAGTVYVDGSPCAEPCSRQVGIGTTTSLSAVPLLGWVFDGFTGCPGHAAAVQSCYATLTVGASITATFHKVGTVVVTLSVPDATHGYAVMTPGAGKCTSASCPTTVTKGSAILVAAEPDHLYVPGFSSNCTATSAGAACTLTATAAVTVTVSFAAGAIGHVTPTSSPTAGGTVYEAGGAFIDCGATCDLTELVGDSLFLYPNATDGYVFLRWTGCDSVSGSSCLLKVTATTKAPVALFAVPSAAVDAVPAPVALSSLAVTVTGSGSVEVPDVTDDDYDSSAYCVGTSTCTVPVFEGQDVPLSPYSGAGTFSVWTGACTGAGACVVRELATPTAVTASFATPVTVQPEGTTGSVQTWGSAAVTGTLGGTVLQSDDPGATATYSFSGTSIAYFFTKGPAQGIATVKVDGVTKANVSQYATSRLVGQKLVISGLANRAHTLQVVVSAGKSAASKGYQVTIDAFAPRASVCGTTCARTPVVVGRWSTVALASASGGKYVRSRTKGAAISITFTGTGIDVYRVRGADKGRAQVYVDGVLKATVNDYATAVSFTSAGSSFRGLTRAKHTIKIVVLRTAGSSAVPASLYVAVDRAVYLP